MVHCGAKEKDKISSGPGDPPDSYPLELPDSRVLAFDLKRMGRDSEETQKQQCQVEASPITVELRREQFRAAFRSELYVFVCYDLSCTV